MRIVLGLILIGCSFIAVPSSYGVGFDWKPYGELLEKYVGSGYKDGIHYAGVDYQKWSADARHKKVLTQLSDFDVSALETTPQKLVFYINAYNFLAINLVIEHPDVTSIRDIGSWWKPVWSMPAGTINNEIVTLETIEHKILRQLKEPRIHFAIVCASLSCPDLRNKPYTEDNLEFELEEQALAFISDSTKGVRMVNSELDISKIFDWFEDDFKEKGGVLAFIKRYKTNLSQDEKINGYLMYNWSLNRLYSDSTVKKTTVMTIPTSELGQ